MIKNFQQPKEIIINSELSLVKYYSYYKRTILWYKDLQLCRQVDNIDFVYDINRLKKMYSYLNKNGECYYIKIFENGIYKLIGDVSICNEEISIVIVKDYQNKHIGRNVVAKILDRAGEINMKYIKAKIYDFNLQSIKMFTSLGFEKIGEEEYIYKIL